MTEEAKSNYGLVADTEKHQHTLRGKGDLSHISDTYVT